MKITVTVKDPDGFYESVRDSVRESIDDEFESADDDEKEALFEGPRAARLGVEVVQSAAQVGFDARFVHLWIDGVGVQLDNGAAVPVGPVAALVLKEMVERDVVERAEPCRADERVATRRRRPVQPESPHDEGKRERQPLHRRAPLRIVEVR